jgi:hypothetical protein
MTSKQAKAMPVSARQSAPTVARLAHQRSPSKPALGILPRAFHGAAHAIQGIC